MTNKIQKPGGQPLVKKSTGLAALQKQVQGAARAAIPPEETLVLVLDVSPSMADPVNATAPGAYPPGTLTKIDSLREASLTLIARCSQGRSQIGVVEFDGYARVHQNITLELRDVGQSIPKIAGGKSGLDTYWSGFIGGTNLIAGLAVATDSMLVPATTRVRRIVLMTDGEDNSLVGGYEPTIRDLEKYQALFRQHNIIVDCVAFGMTADRALLEKIANSANGVVKDAKNADELVKAFAQLEAGARGLLTKGT